MRRAALYCRFPILRGLSASQIRADLDGVLMQFTKFGRTGLTVSRLCLGTGTFGKQTNEAESFRVFDKAADAGVNFIDTADVYPGGAELPEVGRAEEITGRWLKGSATDLSRGSRPEGQWGSSPW